MPRRKHQYGDPTTIKLEAQVYWTKKGAEKKLQRLQALEKVRDPISGKESFVRDDFRRYPKMSTGKLPTPIGGRQEYYTVSWFGRKWSSEKR